MSYDVISSVPVFTQGAVTAAIVHLYNAESGGQNKSTGNRETIRYIKAGIKGAGSAVSVVAGTVAVGACIVLEPCGAIAWLGGSSFVGWWYNWSC